MKSLRWALTNILIRRGDWDRDRNRGEREREKTVTYKPSRGASEGTNLTDTDLGLLASRTMRK